MSIASICHLYFGLKTLGCFPRRLYEYQKIQSDAAVDLDKYVGNPINSYRLIKKMTSDWDELKDVIIANHSEPLLSIASNKSLHFWPSEDDLVGAATGIFRLQDTYRLNSSDLVKGNINGMDYGTTMSAHDCFELGRRSFEVGDHRHLDIWMRQALQRYEEEGKKTVVKADILDYMAYSAYQQGKIQRALKITKDMLELQPDHPFAAENIEYYEEELASGKADKGDFEDLYSISKQDFPQPRNNPDKVTYEQLCRGEVKLPEAKRSQLLCRYHFGKDPSLLIGPHKEEEANLDPRVVVYHDVLSDNEIDLIKGLATPIVRYCYNDWINLYKYKIVSLI